MPDHRLTRLAIAAGLLLAGVAPAAAADPYREKVLPFLNAYCVSCHKADRKSGELDLSRFDTAAKILDDFRQWEHVVTFLRKGEMPPAKAKQPTPELRAEMVANVWKVVKGVGDEVAEGDTLVILESMKMEIPVLAESDGTLVQLAVNEGDVVQEGDLIAVVE